MLCLFDFKVDLLLEHLVFLGQFNHLLAGLAVVSLCLLHVLDEIVHLELEGRALALEIRLLLSLQFLQFDDLLFALRDGLCGLVGLAGCRHL